MITPALVLGTRVDCYREALKDINVVKVYLSSTVTQAEDDATSIAINTLGYKEPKFYQKLEKRNNVIGTVSVPPNHTPEELLLVVDQFRSMLNTDRVTFFIESQTDFDTLTAHFAKEQA